MKKVRGKKKKVMLDTSIQIERIKNNKDYLSKHLNPDEKALSLNFVFYEFKTGFIRTAIDFYCLASIEQTIADAMAKWSNKFKPRELKNIIIIESVIKRISDRAFNPDKKTYLRKIEAAIRYSLTVFETGVGFAGDFGGDSIVKFDIFSSSDYDNFVQVHNGRKSIPLQKFWKKNIDELDKLTSDVEPYKVNKHEYMHDHLLEIKKDITKADKFTINRAIGDAVISVDTPTSFIILTTDKIYPVLRKIIGRSDPRIVALESAPKSLITPLSMGVKG